MIRTGRSAPDALIQFLLWDEPVRVPDEDQQKQKLLLGQQKVPAAATGDHGQGIQLQVAAQRIEGVEETRLIFPDNNASVDRSTDNVPGADLPGPAEIDIAAAPEGGLHGIPLDRCDMRCCFRKR